MKFGQPILSSELSGSLAGVTASSSRGGTNYFRVRARPGNPRSFAQSTIRLILTGLAAAWSSTLNDAQRAAWAAIAPDNSSGIDAYNKGNTQRLLGLGARIDAAPDSLAMTTAPYPQASVSVDASAHSIILAALAAANADASANVYISKPQNTSRLSQQFPYTYAGTVADCQAGGTAVMNVNHPAYSLTAGDIVYVRIVQWLSGSGTGAGQVATPQEFRLTVVA